MQSPSRCEERSRASKKDTRCEERSKPALAKAWEAISDMQETRCERSEAIPDMQETRCERSEAIPDMEIGIEFGIASAKYASQRVSLSIVLLHLHGSNFTSLKCNRQLLTMYFIDLYVSLSLLILFAGPPLHQLPIPGPQSLAVSPYL
jgi:hypothetical protein